MPTQREEVVVDPDRPCAEHLRPDARHDLLGPIAGRHEPDLERLPELRLRKRGPVHLAVRVQGQPVEQDHG